MPVQPLRLVGTVVTKLTPSSCPHSQHTILHINPALVLRKSDLYHGLLVRGFAASRQPFAESGYVQAAKDLNQKGLDDQESQLSDAISREKEKQMRTPWHREGSNIPPVERQRSAGAMTKGSSINSDYKALANSIDRQTVDDTFAASQTHITSDNFRHKFGQERCRASGTSSTSSAASLLLGTLDSVRTPDHQK